MRRIFTTPEFKLRNYKKSIDGIYHREKINKRGKAQHASQGILYPSSSRYIKSSRRTPPSITPIKAPSNFSLINNTEETITYFDNAYKKLQKGKNILLDISDISVLSTDAIAVQIAKVSDERFNLSHTIMGNAPKDKNLQKLFLQSGFYEHVSTNGQKPKNEKKLLIHQITNNKVEPDIAKRACLLGLSHTFNNAEIFEPLYDILIEIMQNTNNHAGTSRGLYDWWLHVYNHPDSTKTSYTMLDLGIGIFESLPVQTFKRQLLRKLGIVSNLDLVPKLFAGEIKSRTSKPERGKGLPQVFEFSQDTTFDKFILISNDVFADLKTKEYKLIQNNFEGTLFYWEIVNNTK